MSGRKLMSVRIVTGRLRTIGRLDELRTMYLRARDRGDDIAQGHSDDPQVELGMTQMIDMLDTLRCYLWREMWSLTEGLSKHHRKQVRDAFKHDDRAAWDSVLRAAFPRKTGN